MVKIFDDFFKHRKRYFSKRPKNIPFELKEALKSVKEELDGHLDTINENTSEIQTSYEYVNEVNDKVEKLAERIEAIELFLQKYSNFTVVEKSFDLKPLTKTEQHVFLVIYALEDEKGLVSYADIIRKTGLPGYAVSEYIARLMEKGIPLVKKYINSIPFIKLNPEFKRLQAKENILCIDTAQKELVNF
ncbi:MarR family transcriptional regulator [Candidatus Woesearchaeota archaeon]|nr:MarR family transcriptional regulator [Candidatus Woesearchaeota archaeon]